MLEPIGFLAEGGAPGRRQPIVPASGIVIVAPAGFLDQRERGEPANGGVKRAGAESDGAVRSLVDVQDDAVSVPIFVSEREEDVELLRRKRECPLSVSHNCI